MSSTIVNLFPPKPKNILFVCTGNLCRSVSAEGILKGMLAEARLNIHVHSAGTGAFPGQKASEYTLRLLKQTGQDLSQHRSRRITSQITDEADIIFVMEHAHREFILSRMPETRGKTFLMADFHPLSRFVSKESNIPDPIGMDQNFYENVNEMIRLSCLTIIERLKEAGKAAR